MSEDLKDSARKIGDAITSKAEGIKARPKVLYVVIGFGIVLLILVALSILY
jgi:hypothetical protein